MSRSKMGLLRAHAEDVGKHDASEENFAGNFLHTQCLLFSMHVRQAAASEKLKSAASGKLTKINPLGTFLLYLISHSMLTALQDSCVPVSSPFHYFSDLECPQPNNV